MLTAIKEINKGIERELEGQRVRKDLFYIDDRSSLRRKNWHETWRMKKKLAWERVFQAKKQRVQNSSTGQELGVFWKLKDDDAGVWDKGEWHEMRLEKQAGRDSCQALLF